PGRIFARVVLYTLAVVLAVLFMGPFTFAALSSLKSVPEIHAFPPTLFPAVPQWQNYVTIFTIPGVPYAQFYFNSVVITLSATLGTVITACVSAYGFARFNWKGRNLAFA